MVGQVHAMSSSVAAADGLSAATRSGMTLVRLVGQLAFAEQPVVEPGQVAFHVIAPGFAIEYAVTLARVHDHFYRLAMRMAVGEVLQAGDRSEEHPSELQSLMRISYAVFCFHNKNHNT